MTTSNAESNSGLVNAVAAGEEHELSLKRFTQGMVDAYQGHSFAVVLIGSVARKRQTPRSDIDVLLVSEKELTILSAPPTFHVHQITQDRVFDRLKEGDDFVAWCIRYGIALWDSGIWTTILKSNEASIWPDWKRKLPHAFRRIFMAAAMLATEDQDAAAEEALYALSHLARILLLKKGVFPLSRAELVQQLEKEGYIDLATLLNKLIYEKTIPSLTRKALLYAKRVLCGLDRIAYRAFVFDQRAIRRKKKMATNERLHLIP